MRVIMESRQEIHKLRLLLIQDLHEKEMAIADSQPILEENPQSEKL